MTRYNITNCSVCNYPLGDNWQAEKVCEFCGTKYDLIHRKTDRTNTVIEPSICRHRHRIQMCGSEGLDGRYFTQICPDCGQIRVFGSTGGQTFDVSFELPTKECVKAAGQWVRLLETDEENHVDKSHLYGPWLRRD